MGSVSLGTCYLYFPGPLHERTLGSGGLPARVFDYIPVLSQDYLFYLRTGVSFLARFKTWKTRRPTPRCGRNFFIVYFMGTPRIAALANSTICGGFADGDGCERCCARWFAPHCPRESYRFLVGYCRALRSRVQKGAAMACLPVRYLCHRRGPRDFESKLSASKYRDNSDGPFMGLFACFQE